MARRLRRDGMDLPVRPGGAQLDRVTLVQRPDGDFRDPHGRVAYRSGRAPRLKGPGSAPAAAASCAAASSCYRHIWKNTGPSVRAA